MASYINQFQAFLDRSSYQTMSLGGVPFHINPDTFEMSTSRVQTVVQTLDSFGRFSFGVTPPTYIMDGMTGIAGLGMLQQLETFRPLPGVADKLLAFTFPARFAGTRLVYCNVFNDAIKPEAFLYNFYHIELSDFTQAQQPYFTPVNGISFPLPVGG